MTARRPAQLAALLATLVVACTGSVPAPTPSAATTAGSPVLASPSPTRTPAAIPTAAESFGIVVNTADQLIVRREDTRDAINDLGPPGRADGPRTLAGAVSPIGDKYAFWQIAGGATILMVWDVTIVGGTRTTQVYTLPASERPLGLTWSELGRGLIITVASAASEQGIDAPPLYSAVRTVHLAGRISELARVERIATMPVAWADDGTAAFVEVGSGSFARAYVLVRPDGSLTRTTLTNVINVRGSPDARWVVASQDVQTQGRLIAWPLTEPTRVVELPLASDQRYEHYGWRPGTREVAVGVRPRVVTIPAIAGLALWDPSTGARRSVPGPGTYGGAVFRADGTAAYSHDRDGGWSLVDLASGDTRRLDVGQRELILAGVLLR